MLRIFAICASILASASVCAQTPYAGMQSRHIKALSDQQIADLNLGRGMGLALAAELNSYPGPSHAIELAEPLGLSPAQRAKLHEQFSAMKSETISIGAQLIDEERDLNEQFVSKTITLARLEAGTKRIAETQAKLRAAHLKYHLSTTAILTPQQVAKYNELRGYSVAQPLQRHHMHE